MNLIEEVNKITKNENGKIKISCRDALNLAEKLNIDPIEIGKICSQEKIKVKSCSLGCFK